MKAPLYVLIKQYRLIYIAQLIFTNWLALSMWEWYKANSAALELASGGAFGAAFLVVLGMVKYNLEGLRKDSGHD